MKIFYIVSIFVCFSMAASAQSHDWQWVKSAGGNSQATGICIDASGNVYVTGYGGILTFGNDTLRGSGMFIVKYDPSGNVIWTRSAGGLSDNGANSISIDDNGYIYITGGFGLFNIILGNDTLTTRNNSTTFTAKYDSTGNVIWARSVGPDYNVGMGVSNDKAGNVYITGYFSGTIAFGNDTLSDASSIGYNVFIAKYDSSGNVVWAKSFKSQNQTGIERGISADATGNVYMTGNFDGPSIIFGTDTLSIDSDNIFGGNIFIAKYDNVGNTKWAQRLNGYGTSYSISTDVVGNVYVTGSFYDSIIIFGHDTLTGVTGYYNLFIVKYDNLGNVLWAKSSQGPYGVQGFSISTDVHANVYVTGVFTDTVIIGNDTLINVGNDTTIFLITHDTIIDVYGSNDLFIIKYDSSGNLIWAKNALGGDDVGTAICADADGNVYVTGYLSGHSVIFGNDTLIQDSAIMDAFFVAKYGTPTNTSIVSVLPPIAPITVYPNPTTGKVYFSGVQTGYTLQVYNVLGEIIYTGTVDRDNYSVNLSGKAKGMYFYRIADAATLVQQGKIVME